MESDSSTTVLIGIALLLANAFFVAAEYALVGARRSKIESLAKKGNRAARHVLRALDDRSRFIAAIQIGITMVGIGLGALTEPVLSAKIVGLASGLPEQVASTLAILIVSYPMVVVGELIPKIVTLRYSTRVALVLIEPLRLIVPVLTPFTWFFQKTSAVLLKPFKIDVYAEQRQRTSREEFALMVQESSDGGEFDESHAQFLTKTLRFDTLDSEDVMIHRLDVQWLDVDTPREEIPRKIKKIQHSRIPVCRGDLDEVLGVVYVQDILSHWDDEDFSLDRIMREPEFVPETLTLDRIVAHMREAKTQIVIVRDEYGGTSGLLTLEDVVEEIFGDMEDRLESERPTIEQTSESRVTTRADVRYDELLSFLRIVASDSDYTTETLASIIVDSVGRVPKIGDSVELPIGRLKVENMARQRITRLAVYLNPNVVHPIEADP
ncbi:MAG TPA: hemolysin family protein [Fimbriimonadaceae bacterium]|nr:hemolysin family protein [Fimbriimonadaceae bacterium]